MARPTNSDDYIDSRDVIAALTELDAEIAGFEGDSDDLGNLERERLNLQSLQEQAEDYSDWQYGATLIKEDHFETYARQLAKDIGAISGHRPWPCNCIDWEKATNELRTDFTSVDFDGETYLVRS